MCTITTSHSYAIIRTTPLVSFEVFKAILTKCTKNALMYERTAVLNPKNNHAFKRV